MKKVVVYLIFVVIIFLSSCSQVKAFSCTSNGAGGGNFNLAATWTGCNGITPQITDSITINSGDTVTLVATTTVLGITINNGGTLAANTRAIINTDGYTNNGSHTGTTSTMTLSGIGSTIDGNGTYSPTGLVTMSIGAKTIAVGSALSFPSMTITGISVLNNSTAGLTVTTALAGTGQLTQGAGSILNLRGTSTITALDASISSNEVHYTSTTSAQTIKSTTYHHLFIDKLGRTGTLANSVTVNGNLSVTAGNLSDGGFQITGNATGTLTVTAGSTLTLGTTASATNFPTLFTSANISLAATSTVSYSSNITQTISNVPSYGNLTTVATASVVKTALGAITVNGAFTNGINNTFADGGFVVTLKDGCTMTGIHTGSGKMLFSGGSGAHTIAGTGSYSNVELDDSYGLTQSVATTIGGMLTITNGTWTSSHTLAVTGPTSINSTISITSTTGTKTFNAITIASGGTLNFAAAEVMSVAGDLTVNGTGSITGATGLWTFSKVSGGTIGGTTTALYISGGVTFATQYAISYPLTVNSLTVNTGVTQTNQSDITINGTLGGLGTFTQNAGAILNLRSATITTLNATASGNIVHYVGGAGGTIKGVSYVNLDINKSSGFTATANGTVNVVGNLTVTSGTINFSSSTFTVNGTTDIYGTLTDSSGGGAGGNTIFQGLVTVHPGAIWNAVVGEVCDFHFGNGLVMNGTSFVSSTGNYYFETNNQNISSSTSFTIDNLIVTGIKLTNSSSGTLTIRATLSGTGEFIQGTNSALDITGTSTINTLTALANGNTVSYSGAAEQTIHAGAYQTLNISNNSSGSANIATDTTVNASLVLGSIILSTGSHKIILEAGSTWSRTSGYVYGTVEKIFTGEGSFTFPVGDVTHYTPVDITLHAVTNTSSIDVSVTGTDHPDTNEVKSRINKDKSVNRFWSLVNNGLAFGSYDLTLDFVSSDIDAEATPTEMTIGKKSNGSWSTVAATCTATSCGATGLTSMSEFQVGAEIISPAVSSENTTLSSSLASDVISLPISFLSVVTNKIQTPKDDFIQATESAALFDVISSPLILGSNTVTLPIVAGVFLISSFGGLGLLFVTRHMQKEVPMRNLLQTQTNSINIRAEK